MGPYAEEILNDSGGMLINMHDLHYSIIIIWQFYWAQKLTQIYIMPGYSTA